MTDFGAKEAWLPGFRPTLSPESHVGNEAGCSRVGGLKTVLARMTGQGWRTRACARMPPVDRCLSYFAGRSVLCRGGRGGKLPERDQGRRERG